MSREAVKHIFARIDETLADYDRSRPVAEEPPLAEPAEAPATDPITQKLRRIASRAIHFLPLEAPDFMSNHYRAHDTEEA